MTDLFSRLAAEFPREAVHWRAQTLTANGDKALALAYLDARDVMDRLDEACTPAGWQNECFETPKGRIIGKISILVDGNWISKCDGAGDTDVEGEKGGISDALKRAAVLWGVGRYLYRLPAVWAPCETYEKGGKKYWKAWKGSPWDAVRMPKANVANLPPAKISEAQIEVLLTMLEQSGADVGAFLGYYDITTVNELPAGQFDDARRALEKKLKKKEAV